MADSGDETDAAPAGAWDESLPSAVRSLADELLPIFYADLKLLARRERSRVGAGGTLHTTALVHEAYLKLRGTPAPAAEPPIVARPQSANSSSMRPPRLAV